MNLSITPLTVKHRNAWISLWQESVGGVMTRDVVDHAYAQLMDGAVHALIAMDGECMVGLLHYVTHPVAGCIHPVCYMQDLYVSPAHRRNGVARALIAHLEVVATTREFDRIYWLLENGNDDAKAFYNGLATPLDFGLHMIPIKMKDRLNLSNTK